MDSITSHHNYRHVMVPCTGPDSPVQSYSDLDPSLNEGGYGVPCSYSNYDGSQNQETYVEPEHCTNEMNADLLYWFRRCAVELRGSYKKSYPNGVDLSPLNECAHFLDLHVSNVIASAPDPITNDIWLCQQIWGEVPQQNTEEYWYLQHIITPYFQMAPTDSENEKENWIANVIERVLERSLNDEAAESVKSPLKPQYRNDGNRLDDVYLGAPIIVPVVGVPHQGIASGGSTLPDPQMNQMANPPDDEDIDAFCSFCEALFGAEDGLCSCNCFEEDSNCNRACCCLCKCLCDKNFWKCLSTTAKCLMFCGL